MVNFELVLDMTNTISNGELPKDMNFNDFCTKYYLETKVIPLSKFLRLKGFSNKVPKIMNVRKAGELLFESKANPEILELIKKEGFSEIPQLNYSVIMILRKTTLDRNWKKIIAYLKGEGTIDQIIRSSKKALIPEERQKINEFIQNELNLNSTELNWLIDKYNKIHNNKKISNSLKKLLEVIFILYKCNLSLN